MSTVEQVLKEWSGNSGTSMLFNSLLLLIKGVVGDGMRRS